MKRELLLGKSILTLAILSLIVFLYGFIAEVGIGHRVLFYLLAISLFFKLLKMVFEWYHYGGLPLRKTNVEKPKSPTRPYSVDMLTTFCPGEPYDMLENTLRAMVAVRYPHVTYLCDEGNDPIAIKLCQDLGVVHVTRSTHENAKAGNVNNALKQAKGEICVILDPDHAPFPDFLDHVLHHFDNPEIGYVQVVQAYGNQSESFIAQGAAEQTYIFYGPYMQAMGEYGTAQAIGANCTFRRSALDSIGGHAPGLTEDMHTSMLLHAKGWKSVYEPVILSNGLVPSSLSAYYKQQLKWSRGTFDLWINLFPKLFLSFNWRQKLHYGLMPVYYLFGVIGLIDFLVPVYSLMTGEYPWLLNPVIFFTYFTPFFLISLIYRFYAQAWLHDPKEKGLHLMGGILRVGTWWVYITGFVYTLLNIKVPYIPTPKEHSSKGELLLGMPNLVLALISISAVSYGLYWDWQPYSILMAVFAGINAIVFFLAFAIGQTTWIAYVKYLFTHFKRSIAIPSRTLSYPRLSRFAFHISLVVLLLSSSFFIMGAFRSVDTEFLNRQTTNVPKREIGGFYSGIYNPHDDLNSGLVSPRDGENRSNQQWSIISTYQAWGDGHLPVEKWKQIIDNGAIPMVTWEPWTNLFESKSPIEDIRNNRKVFQFILDGHFDSYIDQMAETLRDLHSPVFLRFAHEMENPMYSWSRSGGNTPEEFVAAWKYVHFRFERLGAHNVSWVWSPWSEEGFETYFPYGNDSAVSQYVDWIGLTALNYGLASQNHQSKSFGDLYAPFKDQIEKKGLNLPVMVAEFGSTSYGLDGEQWVKESLLDIRSNHPEIKSAVLFYSDLDKNWVTSWRPSENSSFIDWTFDVDELDLLFADFKLHASRNYLAEKWVNQSDYVAPQMLKSHDSNHHLVVDGEPFYIKGICYNAGHDWEEGFNPLTRKQLNKDFRQIKNMGANTIRRYEPSIYDRNILNAAKDHGLKVMYGFWFDPKIDYLEDRKKLQAYEAKVLAEVRKRQNDESIIAWNIGNETWGLLKKHYAQPYLTIVRRSYLEFLDDLAVKIKKIDPKRPVISSEEHDNERLIAAIAQFRAYAPNVDVIGVNSYYEENISQLQSIMESTYPDKPYMVTEFGPKGYWNRELGDYWKDSLLIELSSLDKAKWYQKQWTDHIEKFKGRNLGGMAFSWMDRYEGTATWFGITDNQGKLKPAYYYLQDVWVGNVSHSKFFPDLTIVGHWNSLQPGQSFWVSAAITNQYQGDLNYSWVVYDQDWKKIDPVLNSKSNGQFVEIAIPSKDSRVYVYATDSLGNVITASRPLLVGD